VFRGIGSRQWAGASASRWCPPRTRSPNLATAGSRSPSADGGGSAPADYQDREVVGRLAAVHERGDRRPHAGGQLLHGPVGATSEQTPETGSPEQLPLGLARLGDAIGDGAQRVAGLQPARRGLVTEV